MEEEIVVATCSAVAQITGLLALPTQPQGQKQNIRTVSRLHLEPLLQSAAYACWFEDNIRCTKSTFLRIVVFLRNHGVRFAAATAKEHSFEKEIAASLFSLGSAGGYREAGAAMGMSRRYVKEITTEVVRVLKYVASSVISFPRDLFLSGEVRPGSWSDSKCWKYSIIGRTTYTTIPSGTHFIGGTGYALLPWLIVPYNEREEGGMLSPQQKQFNFLHFSTRIAVERTFGFWKGRFRNQQTPMSQATPCHAADFIVATMVLHNLMIRFRDRTRISLFVDNEDIHEFDMDDLHDGNKRDIGIFKRNAIADLICK
ncbi:unnamed protein product [Phytophthora fragariaefolia]|uniref:Unnamed protein product n=1 Tax=Phytophthora fragariaefolia TaxID=1490495 RepID=A0A9W6Y8G5_9STRA|nr:unnamed protein product [Phytophthora fragariaefolia]